MSSDSDPTPYTRVIDLTTRGVQQARMERLTEIFPEPDPALPEASVKSLPDRARRAVESVGWTELTEVQAKAIPYVLDRRDLIVQSRTGSGKTGAFLLPLLELLDPDVDKTQALVLCPTRELAKQIYEEHGRMTDGSDLRSALVYGGVRYGPQTDALEEGAHLVIGTPGRVLDHLERRTFDLKGLGWFILDEADEMLSMGFMPAIRQLEGFLPQKRRSYMFSATMPVRVQNLARDFLEDPGFLALSTGQEAVETMEHKYFVVDQMQKDRHLANIIEVENPESAIVFCNTKREVEYLSRFLANYGHDVAPISGDLSQKEREKVMGRIREGSLRFLVATDVAARGIDISDLTHVFHYDVPQDPEYYIHRSGRTARAGRSGSVIGLATIEDRRSLEAMAHRYGVVLQRSEVPTDQEVTARVGERLTVLLEQLMRDRAHSGREPLDAFTDVAEDLARNRPEIPAMLLDRFYHEQLHAPDPEDAPEGEREAPSTTDTRGGGGPEPAGDATRLKEELQALVQKVLGRRSNLKRERAERFLPLIQELAEEEPEVLGVLFERFYRNPGRPEKPTAPKPVDESEQQQGRGRGGRGHPRRGRR